MLPTAEGVFVRGGIAAHFDLWVRGNSPAGLDIAKDFGMESLNPDESDEEETVKQLQIDLASQAVPTDEEVLALGLH